MTPRPEAFGGGGGGSFGGASISARDEGPIGLLRALRGEALDRLLGPRDTVVGPDPSVRLRTLGDIAVPEPGFGSLAESTPLGAVLPKIQRARGLRGKILTFVREAPYMDQSDWMTAADPIFSSMKRAARNPRTGEVAVQRSVDDFHADLMDRLRIMYDELDPEQVARMSG